MGIGCNLKRIIPKFQGISSSIVPCSKGSSFAKGSGEKANPFAGSGRDGRKGSCGKVPGGGTSLFCPSVRSPETNFRMETGNRLACPKPVSSSSTLQNGDRAFNQGTAPSRRVRGSPGFTGCVLPHTHQEKVPEISKILYSWCGIQVRGSLFRAVYGSKGLHHGDESCGEIPKGARDADPCLPGRLAPAKQRPSTFTGAARKGATASKSVRNSGQLPEVRARAKTALRFSRNEVRSGKSSGLPNGRSFGKAADLVTVFPREQCGPGKSISLVPRAAQPHSRSGTFGPATCKTGSMVSKVLLHSQCRSHLQRNPNQRRVSFNHSVLDGPKRTVSGSSSTPSSTAGISVFGCQSTRLGSGVGQSVSSRSLEQFSGRPTLQHKGDYGDDQRLGRIQGESEEQGGHVSFRQPYRSVPCAEARGDSLLDSLLQDSAAVSPGREDGNHSQSQVDAWEGADRGRFSQQDGPDHACRMVSPICSLQETIQSVPRDLGGPLCDLREQEASKLCQPVSRREGIGSGCLFPVVGRVEGICLSTFQDDRPSSKKDSRGSGLCNSNSTSLGRPSVVSNVTGSSGGFPKENSPSQEGSVSEGRKSAPQQATGPSSTRLAIVKRGLQAKGFSDKVSERATLCNRESTRSIYDSRFSRFQKWCVHRERSLEDVTIQEIADFLMVLFDEGLSVSTISGYRTAISSAVGSFGGFPVGAHPVISKLISAFKVARPVNRVYFPAWNVNIVLDALMKSPFEPPRFGSVQDRKFASWKTAFLVAFSSFNRASEIHAISRSKRDLIFLPEAVQLRAIPGFLAKTQSALCDSKPYKVASHKKFVHPDMEERFLCPRRMLLYYLKHTGGYKDNSRLFVKCKGKGVVCKNTVSAWLKNLILYVYEHSDETIRGSVAGHDVRRLAASWSFAAGTTLSDILEAGCWKRTTTFTTHYLKDVVEQPDGVFRLGALPAGSRMK